MQGASAEFETARSLRLISWFSGAAVLRGSERDVDRRVDAWAMYSCTGSVNCGCVFAFRGFDACVGTFLRPAKGRDFVWCDEERRGRLLRYSSRQTVVGIEVHTA